MLRGAHDSDIIVLHNDMDQGMAQDHTDGQQGRTDGTHTAEEQGEGGENVGHGGHTVRGLVVTVVRDICQD